MCFGEEGFDESVAWKPQDEDCAENVSDDDVGLKVFGDGEHGGDGCEGYDEGCPVPEAVEGFEVSHEIKGGLLWLTCEFEFALALQLGDGVEDLLV